MSEFTGERLVPGEVNADLWNDHFARYSFARQFAAGRRVLDVGCGTGYGAAHLTQVADSVVALDPSSEAIAYAAEHYRLGNLAYQAGSASELPFDDARFDLVTCFEVIEHVEEWARAMDELARVCTHDGIALISTPNKLYYTDSRGNEGPNPFHVHEFEAQEFETELRRRFGSVTLLLQNRTECITFHPHRIFGEVNGSLESRAGTPGTAHFFLAVCSREPGREYVDSFVFVPRTANVLREREQHIALLQKELGELPQAYQELNKLHEEQNQWALATVAELEKARAIIAELHDQARATTSAYEERIRELDADCAAKARWAIETSAAVDAQTRELAKAVQMLNEREDELNKRTEWALDLQQRLQAAEAQLGMARLSRWVRVGRAIGVGPEL